MKWVIEPSVGKTSGIKRVIFMAGVVATFALQSCGEEAPSFVETGTQTYAVTIDGEGDSVVAVPEKTDQEIENILNGYDDESLGALDAAAAVDDASNSDSGTESVASSNDSSSQDCIETGDAVSSENPTSSSHGKSKGKSNGKTSLTCGSSETVASNNPAAAPSQPTPDHSQDATHGLTSKDVAICSALTGVDRSSMVTLSGNSKSLSVKSGQVLAVRVTGNQNLVSIDMSEARGSIPGICVFAAGNQAKVDMKLGVTVGRIVYISRGNQTRGTVEVGDTGVISSGVVSLRGNNPTFAVSGKGQTGCDLIRASGDLSGYVCN